MLQPPTPPPMMTTRAWVGNSDAMRGLLEPLVPLSLAHPLPLARALEVPIGVIAEVEVELRDAALQEPPHRLAHVGGDAHQAQSGQPPGGRLAEISLQQQDVLRLVEIVMAGEVRQIEESLPHGGVLPIQNAQRAVIEEVGIEQIVVAQAGFRSRPGRDLVQLPVQPVEVVLKSDISLSLH